MLNFIIENLSTIIVSIAILGIITAIVAHRKKSKAKGNACGGCDHCPSSSICHK